MFSTASSFARKLSVAIVVALLGGVLAPVATASSASAASRAGLNFILDENNNATVTSCDGQCSTNIVIPSTLDGYSVTTIGVGAFEDSPLTSVTIPASVTRIEAFALATAISDFYFLGNAPVVAEQNALDFVALGAKAHISATATGFGTASTWYGLVIERALPADGNYVCTTGLLREGSDTSPTYTITNGVVENGGSCAGTVIIPEGVTSIGLDAFRDTAALTSITIPSTVTSLEAGALRNATALASITIPAGVASIGQQAFSRAFALTSITFAEGSQLASIGQGAFYMATGLTTIAIPSGVTSIGSYAFKAASLLEDVTFLGDAPVSVGESAFDGIANGAKAHISATATGFGIKPTWNGLYIANPNMPANGIYKCATGLPLEADDTSSTYTLTNGVVENGLSCSDAVVITAGAASIGDGAFALATGLTSITIPASVTSIGEFAFVNATGLTSINIPASVTTIGQAAFAATLALTSIAVDADNQSFTSIDGVLLNKDATTLIQYPAGKSDTTYSIPAGVTSIGYGAFMAAMTLTSVTIPSSVTSIEDSAFYYATGITSINIPASVTSIGEAAFEEATSLTSIIIPEGVTRIESSAFRGAIALTSITIPSSITSIGNSAFRFATSLSSITFAQGSQLTSIEERAFFSATALTSITIPAGVTSIGERAFGDATALAGVNFLGNAPTSVGTDAFAGIASGAKANISATATGFGTGSTWNDLVIVRATSGPANGSYKCATGAPLVGDDTSPAYTITGGVVSGGGSCAGAVVIPEGVTSIGISAFQSASSLTSITIPASVTSIGNFAFYYASALHTVTFAQGSQLTSIGNRAFDRATALTSITIPSSVTSIGYQVFYKASALTAVTIPASVTSIGNFSFYGTSSLTTITVDPANQSFTSIDGVLFNKNATSLIQYPVGKSATSFTIPSSVTSIGNYAFAGATGLTSITIPSSVTSIGEGAFYNASALTSITIPAGVTSIGDSAFSEAWALTSITFGQGSQLTSIGEGAFYNASALTSISIPASVTSIGSEAFLEAYSLKDVHFLGNAPAFVGSDAFYDIANGAKAHISATATGFGTGPTWNGLIISIPVPADGSYVCTTGLLRAGGDTSPAYTINNGAVKLGSSCAGAVVIPRGATSIAGSAFQNATGMTAITIPSTVTSIAYAAFYNASALTSITIPPGVTSIPSDAFGGATSLASISIPVGVKSIGSGAFSGATALTSITIPASVTSIGNSAFYGATGLTAITVSETNQSFTSIDGVLFNKDATTLIQYPASKSGTSYSIPVGVTSIGVRAFADTTALTSVTIPSGVVSVAISMFENATALTSITIPSSVTSIGSNAFKGATALTSITIPAGVTSIGGTAFRDATALKDVYFLGNAPDSVGFWAFNSIANGAKAYIGATATGFGTEPTWNDLEVLLPYGPSSTTGYVNCTQGAQNTGKIIVTNNVIVQSVGCSGEVSIPAGVTGIAANAFQNASSLASIYFRGKAPTTVAANAFAGVSANATVFKTKSAHFKLVDGKWNGFSVENAVVAKFFGNGSKVGTVPSQIMRPAGQSFVAPENTGGLGKNGYTFLGWNTLANGRGTSYAPGATVEMRQAGMMLHSTWSQNPTKAETGSKPVISGFTISTSNGKNSLGVSSGPWSGFPKPVLSYQWYSCTDKVSYVGSTVPETCSEIASATSSKLALTKRFKGQHIVVSVTGQSAGTSPTVWYSKSSAQIK